MLVLFQNIQQNLAPGGTRVYTVRHEGKGLGVRNKRKSGVCFLEAQVEGETAETKKNVVSRRAVDDRDSDMLSTGSWR